MPKRNTLKNHPLLESVEREYDVTKAIIKAVKTLRTNYLAKDSFMAVSPAFYIPTNIDDIPPLHMRVMTPHKEKDKEDKALEFCQQLVDQLKENEDFEDFKRARTSSKPPSSEINFAGL